MFVGARPYNGPMLECIRTSRFESSPVKFQKSCRIRSLYTASFVFVNRIPVTELDGCYMGLENECGKFYVLLAVHLDTILVNNQLDAQFFLYIFISTLYMFRATMCSSS